MPFRPPLRHGFPCTPRLSALPPGRMVRFSIFGIPVEVQPWFWLTLALIGGINDAGTPDGLLKLLLFVLAGFISVLVHELGHALTGKRFGAATAITLHAFGGYATFPAGRFTRLQDFLVTAAGPAIQLVLGGIFLAILKSGTTFAPMGVVFIKALAGISIVWAILNLIPVIPLDGGRLMSSILGPRQITLTLKISMTIAVATSALLLYFNIGIIFPILLGFMAYQNWQELQHRRQGGL